MTRRLRYFYRGIFFLTGFCHLPTAYLKIVLGLVNLHEGVDDDARLF